MHCLFQPTGETNGRGLPKLRCARAGCANVCYTHHAPERIHIRCRHPALFQAGDFAAAIIKAVTLGLVREKPGCGCARRRRTWNDRWSLAVPGWMYRMARWIRGQKRRRRGDVE